ncbi:hypothetical protein GPX89_28655 [Nocardia sp. ET3-3]|uniref:DUF8020 domain-containing protein n=1 Tax=Nocardia terrae TaxID=2675851 RepID=A0A7K1V3Y0_9NOCA|nr:hypothetical protein [Nocardia terrae]MVU81202.1 hypothetical protein [Nocardia terrae]
MRFRSTLVAGVLVVGASAVTLGTAHAEPAGPAGPEIKYSLKVVDKAVVATLRGARFTLGEQDGTTPGAPKTTVAEIKDDSGATVVSMPLDYRIGDVRVPVEAVTKNDGTVLEITPTKPENVRIPAQPGAVRSIASPTEDQKALNEFSGKLSVAGQVGALVGGIIGFAAGCVASIAIGCLPGGVAGVPAGGIIGGLVAGGPTLLVAGIDLLNTWQAAPGTSKWADPQPTLQN